MERAGAAPPATAKDEWFRRDPHAPVPAEKRELVLLSLEDEAGCFLPFRGATSGKQAYGAGRCLDIAPGQERQVHVDCNRADDLYCAYEDAFSCPLPPPENWLRVPVRAGKAV